MKPMPPPGPGGGSQGFKGPLSPFGAVPGEESRLPGPLVKEGQVLLQLPDGLGIVGGVDFASAHAHAGCC